MIFFFLTTLALIELVDLYYYNHAPKSWNINYDIGMLYAFHAKYDDIAIKIFHMHKAF